MLKSKFRQAELHDIPTYNHIDQQLPVANSDRKCTDILCTIIGLGFTIALAVIAFIFFDQAQYQKSVFPADTDGFTCGHQYPGYNYLYFGQPTELTNRVCVKYCPSNKNDGLACKKTSSMGCSFGSTAQYYQNQAVINNFGQFCMPKDEDEKKSLQQKMNSYSRDLYYNSVNTIGRSLLIVAIASVIYMFLVQIIPKIMFWFSVVFGTLALVGLVITILIYPSNINPMARFVILGLTALLLIVVVCSIGCNISHLKYNIIFLQQSTKFVCQRLYTMLLPFAFIIILGAFYFIQILQYRSFWTHGTLKFDPSTDLYHKIQSPVSNYVISFLQIIQILWGTFFIKQAFNYLISSQAVEWYYGKGSACVNGLFTLVFKHLGSVIACAFMNAFFSVLDFIFDILIPDRFEKSDNFCGKCCAGFAGFFDLVRSDALAFVYLTGQAYCNSARYCDYIVHKSKITQNSQGLTRVYRITSHFCLAGIISVLSFWVLNKDGQVSIPAMFILLLLSLGITTFFVSLHSDAAQAITILYLTEEQFAYNRGFGKKTQEFDILDKQVNNATRQIKQDQHN